MLFNKITIEVKSIINKQKKPLQTERLNL